MCDDDKFGGLEVYIKCAIMIRLEAWGFGGLEVYVLCVMMISLEVWKFESLGGG